MVFLPLFDNQVSTHGEIYDGSGDVAHVDGIVDQCAPFAGGEFIRWFVLCRDRPKPGITATSPPPPKHQRKRDDRKQKGPVTSQGAEKTRQPAWLSNRSFFQR